MEPPEYFNFATDVFDAWAETRPDSRALWCVHPATGTERTFTFRELSEASRKAASLFLSQGLRPGDPVLVMLPRMPQWWIAILGLIRLGAIPVPATLQLTRREVAYRLKAARVRGVVVNLDSLPKLDGFDGVRLVVGDAPAGWTDFDAGLRSASVAPTVERTRSDAPSILYFTSATTGEPKMVLHTHSSYGLGHRLTGGLWLDLKPQDVHWNISDLGWAKAAWSSLYGPWQTGACVFALDAPGKFDPALTLRVLADYPITTCCAPPTALRLIVRENLSRWQFPHLRHCVTAGEPLNPEVLRLWQSATGLTLYEAYGQTETVVLIGNLRGLGKPVRPGSMGQVVPGFQIGLLDENGRELSPGQEGEIAVRTQPLRPVGLFKEYWLNPEETRRQFRDGWYLTGDRAIRDPEGYFWFVGRKDDVIKSSGYRIGPFEVESALQEHPAVLEAAVVGKPDELRGQIVKAFVLLRPQVVPEPSLVQDLQRHCKQTVAPYKYPREIEFVTELPKTISGKTRRVELRQRCAAS